MQISKVQNYNTHSNPNFTALRLKPEASRLLSSMPQKALSYVDGVGELLKDTKYYHVDISKDVCISHVGGDKYYYPHNIQKSEKILILRARGGYLPTSVKIKFDTAAEASKAYEEISASETPLVRAAKIAKYLDEQEIKLKEKTKQSEQINPNDSHEEIVKKLMGKYGV